MNLEQTIRCYGTSAGVSKAWDERGRDNQEKLAEQYAQSGKGTRKNIDGVQVYYPTFAEVASIGMHTVAIIAGRNILSYHDTNSGTKWNYKGQSARLSSTDDAVQWAVMSHIHNQTNRQRNKPSGYQVMWSQASLSKIVRRARRVAVKLAYSS